MSNVNTHHLPHGEIMVVEDNAFDLKFLSETLKKAGYQVRSASDGELALRSLQAKLPDLILLDINLPGMKGVELCCRLKADPETRDLPVIFISAADEIDLKVKALEAGGIDYITKPIEPLEVLVRINTHLNMYRLQRRLALQSEDLIKEIEERKQTEEALRESEAKHRAFFENAQDAIFVADGETGMILDANKAAQGALGKSLEEIMGMHQSEVVSPEEKKTGKERFAKVLKGGEIGPQTYEMVSSDGHRTPVEAKSNIVELKDRKLVLAFFRDLTDRKRAEEALQKAHDELGLRVEERTTELFKVNKALHKEKAFSESLIHTAQAIILVLDVEGRIVRFNPYMEKMCGYKLDEVQGKDWFSTFLPEQDFDRVREVFRTAISDIKTHGNINPIVAKDGREIIVEWYGKTLKDAAGNIIGILSIGQNITSRIQAEKALQKAHDELESRVADRTEELRMRTHDLDERVKELNCFYGISRLLEKPHISLENTLQGVVDLIPSSWQYPEKTCTRIVVNGQEFKTKNFKENSRKQSADINVHSDRVGVLEVHCFKEKQKMHEQPFLEEESHLVNAIAQRVGNILERFQIEKALIIRDKAIASSINGIALYDIEGNLIYVNESCLKMWGYDESEALGKPVVDFWLREKEAAKVMKALIDKGTWTGELIAKRKDNSLFNAQVLARLITDDKGKDVHVVSSFIDVTKEKILQDELIRSERLAASGGLAASIAHEINSPLQGIRSIISSIERNYKQDEGLVENLNLIKGGFTSIRDIVKRLLDLNRPGKEKKQPMNVNRVIEDTAMLLKGHLKKNTVKVNLILSSRVPTITASPQQLGQLFLNLINNSVEAMAGVSNGKNLIINSNLRGENIVIKVADTGPGIPKRALKHIFDPFYTKKKKMGMGIGLSICHGIMEDHKGSIAVKNSPDGGAVFTITLPAR